MSLNIKATKKQTVIAPEGTHIARLYSIVDLGSQKTEWQGVESWKPKVRVTFELPKLLHEFDGVQKPLVVGGEYTLSVSDKSKLKPVIEGVLGRKLTPAEQADFSSDIFKDILGKAVLVNIVHSHKDDMTYANLSTVSPMLDGVEAPEPVNESVLFDIADGENEVFKKLPEFIQNKIKTSMEFNPVTEDTDPFGDN